jgi:hypothetical protein
VGGNPLNRGFLFKILVSLHGSHQSRLQRSPHIMQTIRSLFIWLGCILGGYTLETGTSSDFVLIRIIIGYAVRVSTGRLMDTSVNATPDGMLMWKIPVVVVQISTSERMSGNRRFQKLSTSLYRLNFPWTLDIRRRRNA